MSGIGPHQAVRVARSFMVGLALRCIWPACSSRPASPAGQQGWARTTSGAGGGRPVRRVETPCCHGVPGSRPHDFGLQHVKKGSHPAVDFSDTSVADRQLIHFDWKGYELSPLKLRHHSAFRTSSTTFLASPNSIIVLSRKNNSFSTPA